MSGAHTLNSMYDYQKIINTISGAIDTDELDRIIENFVESVSARNFGTEIIHDLYLHIGKELPCNHFEKANKIKRALVLIEVYLA